MQKWQDESKKEEPELGKLFLQRWREKRAETEAFAGHEEEKDSGPKTQEQLLAEINHLREQLGERGGEKESESESETSTSKRGGRGVRMHDSEEEFDSEGSSSNSDQILTVGGGGNVNVAWRKHPKMCKRNTNVCKM